MSLFSIFLLTPFPYTLNHSYLRDWFGNLAMKTMVLQFMLEGSRPCTIFCFNVHTTVEYLNKKVSIGQLLQHIPNSIIVCAGSRPKSKQKYITKKFVNSTKTERTYKFRACVLVHPALHIK